MAATTSCTAPAQQAYSLDYYSLNKVFYGAATTHQSTSWRSQQSKAHPFDSVHEKSSHKKHSARNLIPFLGRRHHHHHHQKTHSSDEEKSTCCSTSDHLSSPRSSCSS